MSSLCLVQLFEQYMQHCSILKNYASGTISSYKTTLYLFFNLTKITDPKDLNVEVLERYFFNCKVERDWSPATFHSHFKHMNTFLKWLCKKHIIERNFLESVDKPTLVYKIPRTLSKEKAQLVIDMAFHTRYHFKILSYRNRAIVATMIFGGLRRKEIINLKMNDVSLEQRVIHIVQSKGNKDRIVPINAKLQMILSEYLKVRNKYNDQSIQFFISTHPDKCFGESGMKKLIDMLKVKTKLDFSAHTFRHTFATLMLEGGCDIYTLSQIMGHAKITTTTRYLACSNQQKLKSIDMHALS